MNMTVTTAALAIARDNHTKVLVQILTEGQKIAVEKANLINTDSEYAALKNEGLRTAYMEKLLSVELAVLRALEVDKLLTGNELAKAEDNNRLAKYLIIQAAGKLVA
jgi:hypothetical protein